MEEKPEVRRQRCGNLVSAGQRVTDPQALRDFRMQDQRREQNQSDRKRERRSKHRSRVSFSQRMLPEPKPRVTSQAASARTVSPGAAGRRLHLGANGTARPPGLPRGPPRRRHHLTGREPTRREGPARRPGSAGDAAGPRLAPWRGAGLPS